MRAKAATLLAAQPRHRERQLDLFANHIVYIYGLIVIKGYGKIIIAQLLLILL